MHKLTLALFWGALLLACAAHSRASPTQFTVVLTLPEQVKKSDHDPHQISMWLERSSPNAGTVFVDISRQFPYAGGFRAKVTLTAPDTGTGPPPERTIDVPSPFARNPSSNYAKFENVPLSASTTKIVVHYNGPWEGNPHKEFDLTLSAAHDRGVQEQFILDLQEQFRLEKQLLHELRWLHRWHRQEAQKHHLHHKHHRKPFRPKRGIHIGGY